MDGPNGHQEFDTSLAILKGTFSFENRSYARRPLEQLMLYGAAWDTATNGVVNKFAPGGMLADMENTGYWLIYMTTPDNKIIPRGEANYFRINSLALASLALLENKFQNGYFKSYLDSIYTFDANGKSTSSASNYPNNQLYIYQLLWYDPNVKSLPLSNAPKHKVMGRDIVARTGFNRNDTIIQIYEPDFTWDFHNALEVGSFYIWKNGHALANLGSYYDYGNSEGNLFNFAYNTRTISRNSVLILDPDGGDWPAWQSGYMKNPINDGGQRFNYCTAFPPHSGKGRANAKAYSGYELLHDIHDIGKHLTRGDMLAYDSQPNYLFASMDLEKAYDAYPAWSVYPGNNHIAQRLNAYKRDFLWLNDKYLIVYDRVDAIDGGNQKSWLLHSGSWDATGAYADPSMTGMPVSLDGKWIVIKGTMTDGIQSSTNTSALYIDQGNARLYAKILAPSTGYSVRRIGGDNYEFWVEGYGKNGIPIAEQREPRRPHAALPDDNPGAWRYEIRPNTGMTKDNFLNVLYPTDISDTMPSMKLINGTDCIGAYISDRANPTVAIFTDVAGLGWSLSYGDSHSAHHIITGLQPGEYELTVGGRAKTVKYYGQWCASIREQRRQRIFGQKEWINRCGSGVRLVGLAGVERPVIFIFSEFYWGCILNTDIILLRTEAKFRDNQDKTNDIKIIMDTDTI